MCDLLRDKTPSKHTDCKFENMTPEEHKRNLEERLRESVDQYLEKESLENMADILEVLNGLLSLQGLTLYELEKQRIKQYIADGGYEKGIKKSV